MAVCAHVFMYVLCGHVFMYVRVCAHVFMYVRVCSEEYSSLGASAEATAPCMRDLFSLALEINK